MCVNASGLFNKKIGDNNLIWNEILPKENNEQLLMRFFHTDMPWSTPGVLWRRDFFVHIGGWDERLIAWQDWDLHVRALFKKPEIAQCNEVDNYVRISKRNSIGEKIRTKKYYDSLSKILNNVYQLIKLEKHREDKFSKIFEILKIQKLIFLPMDRGLLKIPPQFFLKLCFFGLQFRFTFLWVYLVQLGSKSSKIKKYILKDILKVQRAKYSSHSTHLKILNKQYDQYHRTVL